MRGHTGPDDAFPRQQPSVPLDTSALRAESRVAVLAEYPLLAELASEVLRRERWLDVRVVVGSHRSSDEQQTREALATASVLVYVAGRPLERPPWRTVPFSGKPRVLLVDPTGQVGVEQALSLGARGYVGPQASGEILIQRVMEVASGRVAVPPRTMARLRQATRIRMNEDPRVQQLSESDRGIMRLKAHGLTVKEAAVKLKLSPDAIAGRIRRAVATLGVANEREAAALLAWAGQISWDEETPGDDADDLWTAEDAQGADDE